MRTEASAHRRNEDRRQSRTGATRAALAGLVLIWFAAACGIGVGRLLVNDPVSLFPPVAVTAVLPVAVFLALYTLSVRFRAFILAQNIRTLTMLHHWRVIGFAFLPLYAFGVLPGLFAWPAGMGDIAIGLVTPLVIARIGRDPAWATSAGMVRFHLLGLLDFAFAFAAAGLAAGALPALIVDGVTSAPLDVWPLNLFPSFIVPIFVILHLSVLLKIRHLRQALQHPDIPAGTARKDISPAPSGTAE